MVNHYMPRPLMYVGYIYIYIEVFAGMYRDHYEVAMKLPAATNSEDLMKEAAIMTYVSICCAWFKFTVNWC